MRGGPTTLLVFLITGLTLAATTAQALEIRVQGESAIEMDTHVAGTVLHVSGSLRDDLGIGLPVESVEIFVRNYRETLLSETIQADYQGRFSRVVEFAPGVYEVEARYRGGSHISSSVAKESVTLEALPTELNLSSSPWVAGPEPRAPLSIQATAGGRGLATFATVSVNGELVASVDLDSDGRGTFEAGPHLQVGENIVSAQIEGSEFREAKSARFSVRRVQTVQLRGEVDFVFRRLERGVEVEAFVSDPGGGIENAEVAIELLPQSEDDVRSPLAGSVRTDRHGRAVGIFSLDEVGQEVWEPSARVAPPEGDAVVWVGSTIQQEDSVWADIVRVLAMLAVAGGALWLGRRAVGSVWGAALAILASARREKSDKVEDPEIFAAVEDVHLTSIPPLVEEEDADAQDLVIQLWDEWQNLPIVGARLVLNSLSEEPSADIELVSKEKGVIQLPALSGRYELRVEASGFVPARTELVMPSKRRQVRMSLTPVPIKIRQIYRWMLEQAEGRDHWGRLTPREIEDVLWQFDADATQQRSHERAPWQIALSEWPQLDDDQRVVVLLQAITELVEETNFSGRRYDHSLWETSRAAMEELARRLQLQSGEDHHDA